MNPMFYFLLALTAVLAATANAAGTPILDTDGNPLIANASYYVKAVGGGGLSLNTLGVNICPSFVGVERSADNDGIPVKFSDWTSGDPFVPESETLNIEMDVKDTLCIGPTYWRISTAPAAVVPASSLIQTGPKPSSGRFALVKNINSRMFRIVWLMLGRDITDVGLSVDNMGVSLLGLNAPSPLEVEFKKVLRPRL